MANQQPTFASSHYPLEILGRKVHILNACATYASIFQQIVTKSNLSELSNFIDRSASTASSSGGENNNNKNDGESRVKSYFDLLTPSITTSTQHIPHGQMKRISLFRYIHPNGVKVISAEAVASTLRAAKMPFITDLISKSVEKKQSDNKNNAKKGEASNEENSTEGDEEVAMFEQLREMNFQELDIARFCLCALWELAERNVFDSNNDGDLTPLAKRDLKKALSTSSSAAAKDDNNNGGAAAAAASATGSTNASGGSKAMVGTGTANGPRAQKNLRALLEEECSAAWPHTPIDKAVMFTIVNDPKQPRHKPLFKATIEFPLLKKMKVEGEWAPTKRDAENSAADKSLPTVRRLLKK